MPQFLNMISATIYGNAGAYDGLNGQWQTAQLYRNPSYQAFPKNGIRLYALSPAQVTTNAGVSVTLNSIIEILPTGLGITSGIPQPLRLLSDSTFTNLYNQGA
jgi:hypothetical protein